MKCEFEMNCVIFANTKKKIKKNSVWSRGTFQSFERKNKSFAEENIVKCERKKNGSLIVYSFNSYASERIEMLVRNQQQKKLMKKFITFSNIVIIYGRNRMEDFILNDINTYIIFMNSEHQSPVLVMQIAGNMECVQRTNPEALAINAKIIAILTIM